MSDSEVAQPAKRSPGRPRKAAAKPAVDQLVEPPADAWRTPDQGGFPPDERIGTTVEDPCWSTIVFSDDRQYRIEKGVIVERVR